MAESIENGEDKAKLFDEFKAKIAEAKLPTSMGKLSKIFRFSLRNGKWNDS
jgi:hypothetical protein